MTHPAVNEPARDSAHNPRGSPPLKLVAVYLLAAIAGYALGSAWWVMRSKPVGSPAARVGYALRAEEPHAMSEGWSLLRADVSAVRAAWNPEERSVFDLVVAIRGLEKGGQADYVEAERLCRTLGWPRCDRAALEVLGQRSRP